MASSTGAFEHVDPPHAPHALGQQSTEPVRGKVCSIPVHLSLAATPHAA